MDKVTVTKKGDGVCKLPPSQDVVKWITLEEGGSLVDQSATKLPTGCHHTATLWLQSGGMLVAVWSTRRP